MNSRLHLAALLALAVLIVIVAVRCTGGAEPDAASARLEPESEAAEDLDVGALDASEDAARRAALEAATEAEGGADASAQAEPNTSEETRTLHVVVRSETGAPIEGARVGYVRTEDGAIDPEATFDVGDWSALAQAVRTDSSGRCRLEWPEPSTRAVVAAWAEGRYPLRLPDFRDDQELRFVLTAHAHVFGRVVDAETGAGIAGATVWFNCFFEIDPEHGTATTDAGGAFGPLRAPAETRFWLTARAEGYIDHSGHPIAPAATDSSDLMEIALRPAKSLTVRVLDARTGQPLSGAVITSGSEHIERGTRTDADGVAVLDDVLPTTLDATTSTEEFSSRMEVRAPEHCDVGVHVTGAHVDAEGYVEVPLEPDNVVRVRAVAAEGVRRAGRRLLVRHAGFPSTDHHGYAYYDPSVYAIEEPLSWLVDHEAHGTGAAVELDADGVAVIRNLPPGLYGLEIRSDDAGRRLLATVGPFDGAGETRVAYVRL